MKGAILMDGEKFYTDMRRMLTGIKNVESYNWLITDCECSPRSAKTEAMLSQTYCFLSGDELIKLCRPEAFEWNWAVLTAFKPEVQLESILTYALPRADGYDGFFEERVTMQHPLAEMELVAYDSSLFIVIAQNYHIIKYFCEKFPLAVDLRQYNLGNA